MKYGGGCCPECHRGYGTPPEHPDWCQTGRAERAERERNVYRSALGRIIEEGSESASAPAIAQAALQDGAEASAEAKS